MDGDIQVGEDKEDKDHKVSAAQVISLEHS